MKKLVTESINEYATLDINVGEYAEGLVNSGKEQKAANTYKFYPVAAITIDKVDINLEDEYNGDIEILMSNGDKIVYDCSEVRSHGRGPSYEVSVKVNDVLIEEDEFLDDFSGTWVGSLMRVYEKAKKLKK